MECLELRIGVFWWRDTLCQFHSFPTEFLRVAGELGVAVVLCVYGASGNEPQAEPDAPPNGGPALPVGNSGVTEGPPSVS